MPEQFGRYRIVKKLGQGGMGAVYLAHNTILDRRVALKIPRFRPDDSSDSLGRFYREARAAATIDHPNICPVYDVGETDGVHYLTMAYVEGRELSEMGVGHIVLAEIVFFVVVLGIGLAYVWRKGGLEWDR